VHTPSTHSRKPSGCSLSRRSRRSPAIAQERLEIVATTGMIADAAREVGGDLVKVSALMGPGVDPHAYRQTRSDIVATAARISSCGMGSISRHRWKSSCIELGRDPPGGRRRRWIAAQPADLP
jgi:hypothetical protein